MTAFGAQVFDFGIAGYTRSAVDLRTLEELGYHGPGPMACDLESSSCAISYSKFLGSFHLGGGQLQVDWSRYFCLTLGYQALRIYLVSHLPIFIPNFDALLTTFPDVMLNTIT